jgi:hypothetical protein
MNAGTEIALSIEWLGYGLHYRGIGIRFPSAEAEIALVTESRPALLLTQRRSQ